MRDAPVGWRCDGHFRTSSAAPSPAVGGVAAQSPATDSGSPHLPARGSYHRAAYPPAGSLTVHALPRGRYTASVVQAAEDLWGEDYEFASKKATPVFFRLGQQWFRTLSRAKQFAALLADDLREEGLLEYEHRPVIEFNQDEDVIYSLSRKGKRHHCTSRKLRAAA